MDEWNHPFGGRFIVRDTDNVASYKAMGWSDPLFPCPVFDFQIVDELCLEVGTMEQRRPADIFAEALDYLWNGLGLEEKGWKRLKKGDFKKRTKNGLTYQIWFDRSRYNYLDYEIGHGNVEVGFTCIIKLGDDRLYSFKIESTTGGSFFRMLTEDLRLDTGLLDTFLPLIKAHYLDFIDRFEADPAEALQPVCAPFIQPEDYILSLIHILPITASECSRPVKAKRPTVSPRVSMCWSI